MARPEPEGTIDAHVIPPRIAAATAFVLLLAGLYSLLAVGLFPEAGHVTDESASHAGSSPIAPTP